MFSILLGIIILLAVSMAVYYVVTNTSDWENRISLKNAAKTNWEAANQKYRLFIQNVEKNGGSLDYSPDLSKLVREEIYLYMNFLKFYKISSWDNYQRINGLLKMLPQNERRLVMQNLFLQYPKIMREQLGFTFLDIPPEKLEFPFENNNEEDGWE